MSADYIAKKRFHRIDSWRGYPVPIHAVAGTSYTGEFSDSPCPAASIGPELHKFRKEVLRPAGIKSRTITGSSSNFFCVKRWIVVGKEDFSLAAELAAEWFRENDARLHFLHDADLDQCLRRKS